MRVTQKTNAPKRAINFLYIKILVFLCCTKGTLRITQDSLSWAIALLGLILPALMLTFEVINFTAFSTLMVVWGFGMAGTILLHTSKATIVDDPTFGQKDIEKVSRFTIIAFLAMLIGSIAVPQLFTSMVPLQSAGQTRLLYACFFAVNEETFFRGGFLFQIYSKYPSKILAAGVSAMAFSVFHWAVYGTQVDALWFVFLAGVALAYSVLWSERMTPAYLSHLAWNIIAVGGI